MGIETRPPGDFYVSASLISELARKDNLVEIMAFDWYVGTDSLSGPVARTIEFNLDEQGKLIVEPSQIPGKTHRITRTGMPDENEGRIFAIGYQYLDYGRFEEQLDELLERRKRGLPDTDVDLPQPALQKKIDFFPIIRDEESLKAVIDIATTAPESLFYAPYIPIDNKQFSNLVYLQKFLEFLDEDRSRTSEWQSFFKKYGVNFPPPVRFSAEGVLYKASREMEK